MSNPQKQKGSRGELEVQAILRDELGQPARRALGAGRKDDIGDITGITDIDGRPLVISVKNYKDVTRAINEALAGLPGQMGHAGADYGCAFIRRKGGRWIVVLEPGVFCALWREAMG